VPEFESSGLRAIPDGDVAGLRNTFARFPTGVVAISAVVPTDQGDRPQVLVASSFQVGISLEPPLVLFAVQHTSTTWPLLRMQSRLGVSLLGVEHSDAVRQLASKGVDRFAGIECTTVASGAHFVDRAPMWLECSVHAEMPAGDHDVVLLRVHATASADGVGPLVWHGSGFRTLEEPADETTLPKERNAETSRYWVGPWSALGREALTSPAHVHDEHHGSPPCD
jgi:flavin reductase (DIM6/NTAB) family NADH-FMN oxidoreductase RutF